MKKILLLMILGILFVSYTYALTEQTEDIALFIDSYQPRVVELYDLATPSAANQGSTYTVLGLLKGISTNPTVDITKISSISVSLEQGGDKYVSGAQYLPPTQRSYTFDNMGNVLIYLNKNSFAKEDNIPGNVSVNLRGTISYKRDNGIGIFPQDIVLKEASSQNSLNAQSQSSFWNQKGFVKLDKLDNGKASISVYDSKMTRISSLSLSPGETSSSLTLASSIFENDQLNYNNKVRIQYVKPVGGDKVATLEMFKNNELQYINKFEGEQLYDGSSWRISKINYQETGIQEVTLQNTDTGETKLLKKNQKNSVECSILYYQSQCTEFNDKCTWDGNKCVFNSAYQPSQQQSTSQQNTEYLNKIQAEFDILSPRHKALSDKFKAKSDSELANTATAQELVNDINSLVAQYIAFMDKYPASTSNPYYQKSVERLGTTTSDYTSILEMYLKLKNAAISTDQQKYSDAIKSLSDTLEKYNQKKSIDQTTSNIKQSSKEYYHNAIDYYQKVIDYYPTAKKSDGSNEDMGPLAERRIAEIYAFNLLEYDKSIESYKLLLYKFADTKYVISQKDEIQSVINLLENRNNFDINTEEIIEDSNIITVGIISISNLGGASQAKISIQPSSGSADTYNIGESIGNLQWVLEQVNTDNIIIKKAGASTSTNSEITLKLNNKGIPVDGSVLTLISTTTNTKVLITVLPGEQQTTSVTHFVAHIPIEKRTLPLTPEQIDKEIKGTQNIIDKFNGVINIIDNFNKFYMGYCYGVFSYLYAKNLFTGKTELAARKEVTDKWTTYCQTSISKYKYDYTEKGKQTTDTYSSIDNCLRANGATIDTEVNNAKQIIDTVDSEIANKKLDASQKDLQIKIRLAQSEVATSNNPEIINSYQQDAINEYYKYSTTTIPENKVADIKNNLFDKNENLKPDNNEYLDKLNIETHEDYKSEITTLKDPTSNQYVKKMAALRILSAEKNTLVSQADSDFQVNGPKDASKIGLDTTSVKTYVSNKYQTINANANGGAIPVYIDNIARSSDGTSYTYYYQGQNMKVSTTNDKKDIITSKNIDSTKPYFLIVNPDDPTKSIPIKIVTDPDKVDLIGKVTISDEIGNKGRLKDISIDSTHFIRVVNRGADGTISKIALLINYNPNDITGPNGNLVNDFDYKNCEQTLQPLYKKTTDNSNPILTLSNGGGKDGCQILTDAENKINAQLSSIQKTASNGGTLSIDGVGTYAVQKAVLTQSSLSCNSLYTNNECRLLAGACDPVLCPPSRFNLNGRWQVTNVIQTGIAGGIILGLDKFDPPYEPLPVCMTGINAGLKNLRSVFEGYQQCLEDKKITGQAIGGCSYIRRLGFCDIVWGTATSLTSAFGGTEKIVGTALKFGSKTVSGGNEYVADFPTNFKNSNAFAKSFVSEYQSNLIASYKGKATEEIGSEVCKAAIYGRLPGQGSLIDQLSRPSVPAQFFAVYDIVSYINVNGQQNNIYRVFYNIYAGEDHDITYQVKLKRSSDGNMIDVYYRTTLPIGQVSQKTYDVTAPEGYDQICVVLDNNVLGTKCGFGKVSTEFAINYAQEQATYNDANKVATNAAECLSSTTNILTDASLSSLSTSALSLIGGSGVTQTGIKRQCGIINPGLGTKKESDWVQKGTCGKDAQNNDLGYCWIDRSSINLQDQQDIQNLKEKNPALYAQVVNANLDKSLILNNLYAIDGWKTKNDTALEAILNTIKTIVTSSEKAETKVQKLKDKKTPLEQIETDYLTIIRYYNDLSKNTMDTDLSGEIRYEIGQTYESLGKLKKYYEDIDTMADSITKKAASAATAVKTATISGECTIETTSESPEVPQVKVYYCKNVNSDSFIKIGLTSIKTKVNNPKSDNPTISWDFYDPLKVDCKVEQDSTGIVTCGDIFVIKNVKYYQDTKQVSFDLRINTAYLREINKCNSIGDLQYQCGDLKDGDWVYLENTNIGFKVNAKSDSASLEVYSPDKTDCGESGFLNTLIFWDKNVNVKGGQTCDNLFGIKEISTKSAGAGFNAYNLYSFKINLLSSGTNIVNQYQKITDYSGPINADSCGSTSKEATTLCNIKKYNLVSVITAAANDAGIDPITIVGLITAESTGYPDGKYAFNTCSSAVGILQWLAPSKSNPYDATSLGLTIPEYSWSKVTDNSCSGEIYLPDQCNIKNQVCSGDDRLNPVKSINAFALNLKMFESSCSKWKSLDSSTKEKMVIALHRNGGYSKICNDWTIENSYVNTVESYILNYKNNPTISPLYNDLFPASQIVAIIDDSTLPADSTSQLDNAGTGGSSAFG